MDVSGKILGSFTVSQQLTCAAPHETDDVFVLALLFTDSVKKFRGNSQEVPDAFSHIRTSLGHKKMTRSVCCGKGSDTHMSLYTNLILSQAELLAAVVIPGWIVCCFHFCATHLHDNVFGFHKSCDDFFHARHADGIGINPAQTAGELFYCSGAHALDNLRKATLKSHSRQCNMFSFH